MDSEKRDEESPVLRAMLIRNSRYAKIAVDDTEMESAVTDARSVEFEDASYATEHMKTSRWKLGSQIGSVSRASDKDFRKLKYLHQSIATKANELDSKTFKRNLRFATLLVQWFPEPLIDQAVTELNKTDNSKVIADEAVVIRILGYIEALLRVSCRSIPWSTVFEINEQLGMNIDKNQIAAAKFKAVGFGAFYSFYKKHGNKDTYDVIRFHMVRLIANMDLGQNMNSNKKEILAFSKKLCKYLEAKRLIPKDPEVYGHAIVEIACKKVLKTRNLQTVSDPRLKKKISTAIHYIKKQMKK